MVVVKLCSISTHHLPLNYLLQFNPISRTTQKSIPQQSIVSQKEVVASAFDGINKMPNKIR